MKRDMQPIGFLSRMFTGLVLVILVQYAWAVATSGNKAYLVDIDGAIGPVSQELSL